MSQIKKKSTKYVFLMNNSNYQFKNQSNSKPKFRTRIHLGVIHTI